MQKELQHLREQAKKAAYLEQENKRLKKSLDQKEKRNQQLGNKNNDLERNWENSQKEIEKPKYLLFEANYQLAQ